MNRATIHGLPPYHRIVCTRTLPSPVLYTRRICEAIICEARIARRTRSTVRCVPATHCLASCRGQVAHNSQALDIEVSTTSIGGSSSSCAFDPIQSFHLSQQHKKKHGKLPAPGSFGIVIQDMPLLPHPCIHPSRSAVTLCLSCGYLSDRPEHLLPTFGIVRFVR